MTHIISLPEVIKSFLALPSFIFIPFLFGETLIKIIGYVTERFSNLWTGDFPSYLTVCTLIGFYSIWSVASLLGLIGQAYLLKNLHILLIACSATALLHQRIRGEARKHPLVINFSFSLALTALTILLVSIMPVLIARRFTPFPMIESGTFTKPVFSIQRPLRLINKGYLENEGHWVDFLPVAILSNTFNIDPSSFLWSAPFILTAFYVFYTYLLAYRLSNNKAVSLLTALFGVLVNIMFSMPGQLVCHYKSNYVLQSFFPAVLYTLHVKISKEEYETRRAIKSLVFLSVVIFSFYFFWEVLMTRRFFSLDLLLGYPPGFRVRYRYIQPLIIPFLPIIGLFIGTRSRNKFLKDLSVLIFFVSLIFYFFHHQEAYLYALATLGFIMLYHMTKTRKGRGLIYLLSAICFFYVYFQYIGLLKVPPMNQLTALLLHSPIDPSVHPVGYIFDLKYYIFERANTPVVLFFAVIGSIFAVFSKKREHKLILGMFASAILIYFFPDWWTIRIFGVLSPIMAYILAIAFVSVTKIINYGVLNNFNHKVSKLSLSITIGLLLLILMPSMLYSIYETYSFLKPNQEYYTDMTEYEWNTGIWLRKHTAETERIISDYRSMLHLNPLGQKIWLTPISMYGTAIDWKALYNSNGTNMLKFIKDEIFQAPLLMNKKVETSSIEVIYDDYQTEFWNIISWGSGTYQTPVILNETAMKVNGTDSLKIVFSKTGGTYIGTCIYHQFSPTKDWTSKDFLSLHWYGYNSGQEFAIYCLTANGRYFYKNIIDNWTGWKELVISLRTMGKIGLPEPTWSSIWQITIQQLNVEGTYYLDHMVVGSWVKPNSEDAYKAIISLTKVIPWHESYYIDYCGINESDFSFLIVISPRTWEWIQQEGYDDISVPHYTDVPTEYLNIFRDRRFFEEIYSLDNKIYVFRIKMEKEE